jgi:ParB family chromosome partitioning protein
MAKQTGLGRGLGALLKDTPLEEKSGGGVLEVSVENIKTGTWQPRRHFDEASLVDLTESIRTRGVVQPLLVRKSGNAYELIAGERRFRAARKAERTSVPVILLDATDQEALEIALIENLQREDLNPIEEAEGYRLLMSEFELTQEDVSSRVGKARATVGNALRLLDLSELIRAQLAEGRISTGHAKVLLQVSSPAERELIALSIESEHLSVRALEKRVAALDRAPRKKRVSRADVPPDHVRHLADTLRRHLGTGVHLEPCRTLANGKKATGRIVIEYYSADELDRLLGLLGVVDDV